MNTLSEEEWDAEFQAVPGDKKEAEVYVYVREGCYVTHVVWYSSPARKKRSGKKCDPGEEQLVIAQGLSNKAARALVAFLSPTTDLLKPKDQRRMKNGQYDYRAMILPQCLEDDVLADRSLTEELVLGTSLLQDLTACRWSAALTEGPRYLRDCECCWVPLE